jgi:hypothetical protein
VEADLNSYSGTEAPVTDIGLAPPASASAFRKQEWIMSIPECIIRCRPFQRFLHQSSVFIYSCDVVLFCPMGYVTTLSVSKVYSVGVGEIWKSSWDINWQQ